MITMTEILASLLFAVLVLIAIADIYPQLTTKKPKRKKRVRVKRTEL